MWYLNLHTQCSSTVKFLGIGRVDAKTKLLRKQFCVATTANLCCSVVDFIHDTWKHVVFQTSQGEWPVKTDLTFFVMPTPPSHHKTQLHYCKKQGQTVVISPEGAVDHQGPQRTLSLLLGTLQQKSVHASQCCFGYEDFPWGWGFRCFHAKSNVYNLRGICWSPPPMDQDCNHYSNHRHQNCNDQVSLPYPLVVKSFHYLFLFVPSLSLFFLWALFMIF